MDEPSTTYATCGIIRLNLFYRDRALIIVRNYPDIDAGTWIFASVLVAPGSAFLIAALYAILKRTSTRILKLSQRIHFEDVERYRKSVCRAIRAH